MALNLENNTNTKSEKSIRIYADGVYDMFHFGHARQLEQAKKFYENVHLIAGVSGHEETELKKGKTLMTGDERAEIIKSCKWVDEIAYPCLWVITEEFLNKEKIDYVAHDALPYNSQNSGDIYQMCKEMGKFKETKRTEGVSTSDLLVKIVRERDGLYNHLLKNGFSRKKLNINLFQEMVIRAKSAFKNWRPCLRRRDAKKQI